MKTLLTATALLVASSTAFAGTYTSEASFGTQADISDQAINRGINETITVAGFNTAFGTLTGVSITVMSDITYEANSVNNGALSAESFYELDLDQDWTVTSSVGDFTFDVAQELFAVEDLDHESGENLNVALTTLTRTGSIAASDLSLFASDVDFLFNIVAKSGFENFASGAGDFTNTLSSAAWGKVEVAYTYEEIVTSVPETGSLAIFGLGLAGFALSRKAKKSA